MLFNKWPSKKKESEKTPPLLSTKNKAFFPHINEPLPRKTKNSGLAPLVLWWISGKKTGYDPSTNKFPRWFQNQYELDFNKILADYTKRDLFITHENGTITLSKKGDTFLSENQHVIIIHKHPEYRLTTDDFTNNPQWHNVPNNDIIWGIFNKRQLDYTKMHQWDALYCNYLNMANLLIEEKKFLPALNLLFPAVFLATSGIHDDDKVNEYDLKQGYFWVSFLEINNYELSAPFRLIITTSNTSLESAKSSFLNSKHIQSLKTILPFYYFDTYESWMFFEQALATNNDDGIYTLADLGRASVHLKYNKPNPQSTNYFYANLENMLDAKFGKK